MLADVVVSASSDPEGFGRIIVEAQAMGRPVVATDHGGAREMIVPGVTGWLVPPCDLASLAAAISEVLSLGAEKRQQLGRRAMAHIAANFTREAMCARTIQVYEELLFPRPADIDAAA
jgi:glycosyltransferase involved in cell wall biosynthesis